MKITLFTENYQRGGVDTFIVMLLNNWPDESDEFRLVCNEDHPGLQDIQEKLRRPCQIVTHRTPLYSGILATTRAQGLSRLFLKIMLPIAKYIFLANAVRALRKILCDGSAERLMVINGGYPAGDSCRAAGIAWGMFSNKPASIHNFHNIAVLPRFLVSFQEKMVDRLLERYTRKFITVSLAAAQSMKLRTSIPMDKVTHIYNGLELNGCSPCVGDIRKEIQLPSDAPLCLMLGTYEPRKGHEFLLKVFRCVVDQVPIARFLMCGHGSSDEVVYVKGLVDEYGLSGRVYLLGFRADAMQILRQADVLLVGSQSFESFGLTCVEAMACRIPVVATDVGGLPEVVANDDGGYCVSKDDVSMFANRTVRLLLDDALRKEQGQKGYERYQRLFAATRMATEYAHAIKQ